MTKTELVRELNIHFDKMSYFLHNQKNEDFDRKFMAGKWSTAQHIKHLILSMRPVNLAMRVPKFVLKYKFGLCNRPERSFEQLVEKYETALDTTKAVAPPSYSPDSIPASEKDGLIAELRQQTDKMIANVENWSEEALSKYILPHPLIGKLSFREMVAWSIVHMDHHRMILKEHYSSERVNEESAFC